MPRCPNSAVAGPERQRRAGGRCCARAGPDVRADQLQRDQQVGPPLDLLTLERVDAVAGPHPVGALQDLEVDARAARRAGLDLDAGVPRAQLVEQPVDGERLPVHARALPAVAGVDQVAVVVPLEVADRVLGAAARRAARGCTRTPRGRPGRAPAGAAPPGAAATARRSIQSGCARARSESGLTISGSTHRPNCMPEPGDVLDQRVQPVGPHVARTRTSRRAPRVSSRRSPNQPSSSTNRSAPTAAAASASAVSRPRSCWK